MAEVSNEETHPEPSPKPEQAAPEGSNPKKKRRKKKKLVPVCYFGEAQLNQLDSGNHHEPVPEPEPKPSQDPEHSQPQLFSNSESNPESVAAPRKGLEHRLEHPEIESEPPQDPGNQQPQLFQKSESNPEQVEVLDKPMPAPLISPGLKKSRRKRNKSVGNLEEAAVESNGLNAVQLELKPTPLKDPECPQVFPKPESNSEHPELPNKSEPATPTESRQKKRKRKKLKSEQPVLKPTPLSDPLHFPIPESIPPKDPGPEPVPQPEPKPPQDREQSQPQLFSNSGSNPESVPAPPKGLEYLPGHPELKPENPQGPGLKKRKRKRKKSVGNLDEAAAVSNGLNAVQPSRGPESNSEPRELPNKTDLATPIDSNPESNPESVPAYPKCLEHCPEHPKLEPEPPQDPGHPQPQLFPKLELNPEHIELPYKQMASPIISPGLKKRKRKKKKSVGNFEEAAAESNRLNAVRPELNPTPSKGPECPELFPKPESNSEHHELPDKPDVAIPTDSNPEPVPVPAPPKGLEHHPEHPKLEPEPPQDPGHLQHQLFPKSESNPEHVELPSKPMPAPLISSGVKKRKRKKKKSVGNLEKAEAESKGLDAVQPELKPTTLKDPECPQLCPKPESNSEHHVLPSKPDPATPTDSRQKKRKRKRKRNEYLEEAASNKLKSEQPQLKPTPLLDPKLFSIPEPTSQNDPGPEPVPRPEATPQEDPEQKKKKKKRKKKKKAAPELENTEPNGVNATGSRGLKVTRKRLKRPSERNRLPEQSVMGETMPATAYWFGDGVNGTYFVPVNGMYFVPSNVVFPGMRSSLQCFACRQYGHKASDCQLVKRLRPDQEICFFCGEIGHSLGKCPQSIRGESQYAQCLACKNYGHLSRNCPQNVKGIDPTGGQPVGASGPIDTSRENGMTLSEGPMTRGKVKRIQETFGGHVDELLVQENKVQVEDARRAEVLLIQAQGNQGPA